MAIRMRRGNEADFDPSKMLPGEWAVSTDTKYVRMCFSPGIVLRMATYEAFESDMAEIRKILSECQSIQTAVELIQQNVTNSELVIENYVKEAKQYRDEAEQFRNEASMFAPEGYEDLVKNVSDNTVKIDTIIDKAELNIKNNAKGSNIHLTDSAEANVVSLELYGKTEQNAYTGKNLFSMRKSNTASNGISVTVDNENQSFSATGTATSSTSISIIDNYDENKEKLKNGGTFTMSLVNATFDSAKCNISIAYGYNGTTYWIKANGEPITVPSGSSLYSVGLYIPSGTTVNLTDVKIQLEENNVATEWEPYVGGKSSPSPSYPQEIKSVVLNSIKTHGKNLIKGSQTFEDFDRMDIWTKETETYNGLTVLSKNTAFNGVFKKNFYVESGKTYTFSAFVKTSENHSAQLLLLYANISTAEISINSKPIDCTTEWKRFSITFTCTKSGLICPRVESITDGVRIYVCGYQVEESPIMTEYQPYQSSEVTLSEPIELNGFNGVYDVLTSDGVTRRFAEYTITGDENLYLHDNGRIFVPITSLYQKIKAMGNILCTIASNDISVDAHSSGHYCCVGSSGVYFAINDSFTTADDFINYVKSNTVKCLIELATPTTEELQTDFAALKTFYPETHVSNDADCDMSITYTADAKNYIDNKIALLTTALYNNI